MRFFCGEIPAVKIKPKGRMNINLLPMERTIPEMVERYEIELEDLGSCLVLNVRNLEQLRADNALWKMRHMVKAIKQYLLEQGAPIRYTPVFAPALAETDEESEGSV